MAGIRSFVAVDVGEAIRERVAGWCSDLQAAGADYKWVEPVNYHLTLKFLGEVEPALLAGVGEALGRAAARGEPFRISCRGLGCFPNWQNPRVLWVGVDEGAESLARLAAAVDNALAPLGFAAENRDFRSHLTVARRRSPRGLEGLREAARRLGTDRPAGTAGVTEILLMASRLSPAGPSYSVRERCALAGVCG